MRLTRFQSSLNDPHEGRFQFLLQLVYASYCNDKMSKDLQVRSLSLQYGHFHGRFVHVGLDMSTLVHNAAFTAWL